MLTEILKKVAGCRMFRILDKIGDGKGTSTNEINTSGDRNVGSHYETEIGQIGPAENDLDHSSQIHYPP